MDRESLLQLFKKVNSNEVVEAGWAIDHLAKRLTSSLFINEYQDVGDCLCKINDHGNIAPELVNEFAEAENKIVQIINKHREKVGSNRNELKYSDLKIGMRVRIIDKTHERYLQDGTIIDLYDDLFGDEDVRLRMDSFDIYGGFDPAVLEIE